MTTSTVALGVRLVAALHGDVTLVARPRGVVHLHSGPLTRTGRSVPATARPLCGIRARRLRLVGTTRTDAAAVQTSGRRFCRTCTRLLPARLGRDAQLVTRQDWIDAYEELTVADLRLAAQWAQTVGETEQVSDLLMKLHGIRRPRGAKLNDAGRALQAAYAAVDARRKTLTARAMTDEERAAVAAARETDLFNQRLREKNRRREIAISKAQDRARNGSYLLPGERDLLSTA